MRRSSRIPRDVSLTVDEEESPSKINAFVLGKMKETARQLLRYWSTVATNRNRRPRTLGNISVLVVLRTINETTVVALTSGIENEDNDKMVVKVRDEWAVCAVEDDNTTLLVWAFQR